jgi:transglutaminase-like putative cysteine protease
MVGGAIIIACGLGLALLVRREYFRPQRDRLADAAAKVTPGIVYYGVMQGNRQVGFAQSQVDTTRDAITVADFFVADLPVGGKARRTSARMNATLSRALRVRAFDIAINAEGPPLRAGGHVEGDSVLVFALSMAGEKPDTQRLPLRGPVLLPQLVPLAVALTGSPKVGKRYVMPVFDPISMTAKDVELDVHAESSFVVDDSAVFDQATWRWHGTQPATIRGWQVVAQNSATVFSGWIDAQGQIIETTQLGLVLRRLPYLVALENWKADSRGSVSEDRDILETTAIAADKQMASRIDALKVRLSGVSLEGFDIAGQQQTLIGDTLIIRRAPDNALAVADKLPYPMRDMENSRAEPMLQTRDPEILALAQRLAGSERDARIVAERLNRWVYDSIGHRITVGVPNALQVLRSRTGDCNEHTQLFVALARAIGLPARIASGLAYVDGKFYYHAWPEVLLNDWVAVDPTFGQFPADAAHLRFIVGGLGRQTELLRLMGNLEIDVLATNAAVR